MKVLLIGTGSVGEAIALVAARRPWLEQMVLADFNPERASEVQKKLGDPVKFPVEKVDARDTANMIELGRKYKVDLVMSAVNCNVNNFIFDAAYEVGCQYMDMALGDLGANMGKYLFDRAAKWEQKGLLAILGMGMDPGVSDIFAKYAEKHLFDEIDEVGIRDGAAMEVKGYPFAPTFSVYDAIEECTDPALVWEKDKGWYDVEPFSDPEIFPFPEGIGPLEVVNVEHDEVVLVPRWVKCRKVTFKYALGGLFTSVMNTLKILGLNSYEPINVKGVSVAPIDVVAALLPDQAKIGPLMTGKTCAGTFVSGWKDGIPRKVYLYQSTDNQLSMKNYGIQAVSLQTGIGPVIAMELLANGTWQGKGVLGAEAFDPDPYLALMPEYDFPYGMVEM
ncbi:MAG: ATP-binding protein [Chloroflexi bacterium]|nr:ATP-binding protein [Chloroflexota bacterium]